MKLRAVNWLLLLALGAILVSFSGCASDEPDNASVRPWNSPQGWENNGSLGGMDTQHK
jgi:hypothetical protein